MILEAEECRVTTGQALQMRLIGLGKVDHSPVIAEKNRQQSGIPVQSETADHQPIEMAHEKIGQEEAARLLCGQIFECRAASEKLVTVGARQALHFTGGQCPVQGAPRAAVGIGDEEPIVMTALRLNSRAHGARNPSGTVVQMRREALDLDMGPIVQFTNPQQLPGQGAAGDNQGSGHGCVQDALRINCFAISTAVAASRQ